jgi:hypothetical protein
MSALVVAKARDVSSLPGSFMEGEGDDKDYSINVVSAYPTQSGNFGVECYLRKGGFYTNKWVNFTTFIGPTAGNPAPKAQSATLIEPGWQGRVRQILKKRGGTLLLSLTKIFPPDITPLYKGSLSVFVVDSNYRQYPNPQDVGQVRKDRHEILATKPFGTPKEAERQLDIDIEAYEKATFPGGMAKRIGLIFWKGTEQWSGVFETYYSFS